jgi:hypothetical protein
LILIANPNPNPIAYTPLVYRLMYYNLPEIRSNISLLKAMKGCVGRLGLRDQLATSLIENGKDVCGSLAVLRSVHDVALDR